MVASSSSTTKKSVVILGGGSAGTALTRTLLSKLDLTKYSLTLITERPYYIHLIATPRFLVSSNHGLEGTPMLPYDNLLAGKGKLKLGTATAIEKHEIGGAVVLSDGEKVEFDLLVLAPGSKWEGPLSFPKKDSEVQDWVARMRANISAAKKVVLVGGGAVGSELAGEIKDFYPDTEVTIVHGDTQMLNKAYPDKYRGALEKNLRSRGINLVLGEYVDEIPEPGTSPVVTRSGKSIPTDLVLATRGGRPNTSFLTSLGSKVLSQTGHVQVKPTLQLESYPDIFAMGDVLDIVEQKQAAKVHAHAGVVAANILSVLEGKEAETIYKGSPEMIVITNGRNGGEAYLGVLWGVLLGNWFSRFVKAKHLLLPTARQSMGIVA